MKLIYGLPLLMLLCACTPEQKKAEATNRVAGLTIICKDNVEYYYANSKFFNTLTPRMQPNGKVYTCYSETEN